ncbi:helix-turn-helix transcriptional regulator [Cedecea sp. NFIX57]|uniref:helix-turn-helix transcriptional regulator n=1 Tax=Cedecea sp. NFIX57 TaxID=1566286 RepID=UPI000A0B45BC|nr:LuxR C-terminal-related transcriptional regulator [Cedecea sp. NFIX57]SMG60332.1 regulatory protein, luxR family [Cedecea sp. NFIX57]
MAALDPMDLTAGSQGFHQDFYRFYKEFSGVWYIKSADHYLMDTSLAFSARFFPQITPVAGMTDQDVFAAPKHNIRRMHEFEKRTMASGKEMLLFSWGYFNDINGVKSFIVRLVPLLLEGNKCTLIFLIELSSLEQAVDWLPIIIPETKQEPLNIIGRGKFCGVSPTSFLTEKEWVVAWLTVADRSNRWIAEYMKVSRQAIDQCLRNIYLKLNIADREELLHFSKLYGWLNIIPEQFVSEPTLLPLG